MSSELGWDELNFAMNGLGFVRWRGPDKTHDGGPLGILADVLASDAAACVVSIGGNDSVIVADMRADVATAIDRDLDLLLDRFGHERLAVMDLYFKWADREPPGLLTVRELLASAVAHRGLSLIPGLADVIREDASMLCADGMHPNDDGHHALARAVLPHVQPYARSWAAMLAATRRASRASR